jgi:hypothetical protein
MSTVEPSQGVSEAMVTLLGRMVFPPDQLTKIVMKGKRAPWQYVKAYNLCDGEHGVTEIAKKIGVTHGTLSPILMDWKDIGIVYEVTKSGGTFYKRLYKLDAPKGIKALTGEAEENTSKEEKAVPIPPETKVQNA